MTFDEWWQKKIIEKNDDIAMIPGTLLSVSRAKEIAHEAWESERPHWTSCKDALPENKDGVFRGNGSFRSCKFNVLLPDGYVSTLDYFIEYKCFGSLEGNIINKPWSEILAWMPLPEVKRE